MTSVWSYWIKQTSAESERAARNQCLYACVYTIMYCVFGWVRLPCPQACLPCVHSLACLVRIQFSVCVPQCVCVCVCRHVYRFAGWLAGPASLEHTWQNGTPLTRLLHARKNSSAGLSVRPSVGRSVSVVCLSASLSVRPSVCLPVSLSVSLSVCRSQSKAGLWIYRAAKKIKLSGAGKSRSCCQGKVTQAVWKLTVQKVRRDCLFRLQQKCQLYFWVTDGCSQTLCFCANLREKWGLSIHFYSPGSVFSPCYTCCKHAIKDRSTASTQTLLSYHILTSFWHIPVGIAQVNNTINNRYILFTVMSTVTAYWDSWIKQSYC